MCLFFGTVQDEALRRLIVLRRKEEHRTHGLLAIDYRTGLKLLLWAQLGLLDDLLLLLRDRREMKIGD